MLKQLLYILIQKANEDVRLAKYNNPSSEVNHYSHSFSEGYYDDIITASGSTLQLGFTSNNYYFMMTQNYALFPIYKT